jgi:hypothetical protein
MSASDRPEAPDTGAEAAAGDAGAVWELGPGLVTPALAAFLGSTAAAACRGSPAACRGSEAAGAPLLTAGWAACPAAGGGDAGGGGGGAAAAASGAVAAGAAASADSEAGGAGSAAGVG